MKMFQQDIEKIQRSKKQNMRNMKIGSKVIGDNKPVYIIAEIGGNFSTFEHGKKLINSAISSGADAVKIQTYKAENYVSKFATFNMPGVGGRKNQLKIIKKMELDFDIQKKLYNYCKKKKIIIFSTPSHISDIRFLDNIGNQIYKIGSDDLTNLPLIKEIGKLQKLTFISTGMSTLKDVRLAVKSFYSTGNKKLILLHCVSMYPFETKYANLKAIQTMKTEFNIPVGWSDHSIGTEICISAAALGANVIEKHFTLDKNEKGPDNILSANPNDLSSLSNTIRIMEQSKGNGIKVPAKCELGNVKDVRKSVVAAIKILKDVKITKDMLEVKRPGTGISPGELNKIIGMKSNRVIDYDKPIKWEFLK